MKRLNKRQEIAAQLIHEGELSFVDIALKVGVSDRGLRKWRDEPVFQDRLASIAAEYRDAVSRRGIARRERRWAGYDARSRLFETIRLERAQDEIMRGLPGGGTGLLCVEKWETIKGAPDEEPIVVPVYAVDTGLLKEWRELDKQMAMDMGQWVTNSKSEVSGGTTNALSIDLRRGIERIYAEPIEDEEVSE